MLDIDFICNPPKALTGLIVYRYRTGVLRGQFLDALEKLATRLGGVLIGCEPDTLESEWSAAGLFDGIRVIDLASADLKKKAGFGPGILTLTRAEPLMPTVLCIRGSALNRAGTNEHRPLFIDETVVKKENLCEVLQFLARCHDLTIESAERPSEPAIAYFDGYLQAEGGSLDLRSFIAEYDRAALLYTDGPTGRFIAPSCAARVREARSYVVQSLDRFLEGKAECAAADLVRAFAIKARRGWTAYELAEELCRASRVLVDRGVDNGTRSSSRKQRRKSIRSAVGWALQVVPFAGPFVEKRSELLVKTSEEFLISLEGLARAYKAHARAAFYGQRVGHRADIVKVLRTASEEFTAPEELDERVRLSQALLRAIEDGSDEWLQRMKRDVVDRVCPIHELRRDSQTSVPSPRSFAGLIGRQKVKSAIRQRFIDGKHDGPLVIVGPDGMGKRSMARLYAKALLCLERAPGDYEPCCRCSSCLEFETSENFGYISIDLRHIKAHEHVLRHVDGLNQVSFADHRIIVLANSEQASTSLDAFLKPFEDRAHKTTFIVLATNEASLQSAILSRSRVVRADRLGTQDATSLILERLPRSSYSSDVISLIVLMGNGVPGELLRLAELVDRADARTLTQARSVLALDWGADTLAFWRMIFCCEFDGARVDALIRQCSPKEAASRAGAVLVCLCRGELSREPALLGLDSEFGACVEQLSLRCKLLGLTEGKLVVALLRLWLAGDVFDRVSFLLLAEKAVRLVKHS